MQCAARSKRTGERCGQNAMVGLRVCNKHGGMAKTARLKSEAAKQEIVLRKFVQTLPDYDPECNPLNAFDVEFRRTVARIRYFDDKLAQMRDAFEKAQETGEVSANQDPLVWGLTKEENKEATEFDGTDTTYEARENLYHSLQMRERTHLVNMTKVAVQMKIDVRKLDLEQARIEQLDRAIIGIVVALGHNPKDASVRAVVREQLLALAPGSTVAA